MVRLFSLKDCLKPLKNIFNVAFPDLKGRKFPKDGAQTEKE